jgi:hypothetical protein
MPRAARFEGGPKEGRQTNYNVHSLPLGTTLLQVSEQMSAWSSQEVSVFVNEE